MPISLPILREKSWGFPPFTERCVALFAIRIGVPIAWGKGRSDRRLSELMKIEVNLTCRLPSRLQPAQ